VRIFFTALSVLALTGSLSAQTSAAKAPDAPAPPQGQPVAAAPSASTPEDYSYHPDGRRDPFLSLVKSGTDVETASKRNEGPAGFTVGEISVRGIMQSRAKFVAMIQGPDNKTYVIHQGDKLLDGVVKTVTPQGLVVVQDISDPLSVQKQREVRKLLRSLEDAKEKL
jgi:Tfp pilus assembly protein PilP